MAAYAWHMPMQRKIHKRHVRLFKNGRNQAVRIPREFELPGDQAVMHREGRRLIIEPVATKSLLGLLRSLKPIRERFANIKDLPNSPVDLE